MEIYSNSQWTVSGLKAWKCRRLRALHFSVWLLFDCISKWRKIRKLTGTMPCSEQRYSQGTTEELRFFSLLLSLWALKHSTKRRLHWVRSWRDEAKDKNIQNGLTKAEESPLKTAVMQHEQIDSPDADRTRVYSKPRQDCCRVCAGVSVTPGRISHPELLLQLRAACWVGREDAVNVTV